LQPENTGNGRATSRPGRGGIPRLGLLQRPQVSAPEVECFPLLLEEVVPGVDVGDLADTLDRVVQDKPVAMVRQISRIWRLPIPVFSRARWISRVPVGRECTRKRPSAARAGSRLGCLRRFQRLDERGVLVDRGGGGPAAPIASAARSRIRRCRGRTGSRHPSGGEHSPVRRWHR
jgi:hypothetical protein